MIHKISSKKLEIKVKSKGAELCSVRGSAGYEYMWEGGDEWPKHAPNLFPIVGSLKENTYVYNGTKYHLNRHGFARDRDFDLIEATDHSLLFTLKFDEHTLKMYPFKFEFRVGYYLEENILKQRYEVHNLGDDVLYASFGGHPAFAASPIDNCYLELDSGETQNALILDGDLIGEREVEGFIHGKLKLTKSTFNQDALIFISLTSNRISLKNNSTSTRVEMDFTEFPYLGIWSKPGAPFVCIEPWQGLADFTNTNQSLKDKTGILKVESGSFIEKSFNMQFISDS